MELTGDLLASSILTLLIGCVLGRNAGSIIIYILIMLAAIWLIISPIISRGMLDLGCQYKKASDEKSKDR